MIVSWCGVSCQLTSTGSVQADQHAEPTSAQRGRSGGQASRLYRGLEVRPDPCQLLTLLFDSASEGLDLLGLVIDLRFEALEPTLKLSILVPHLVESNLELVETMVMLTQSRRGLRSLLRLKLVRDQLLLQILLQVSPDLLKLGASSRGSAEGTEAEAWEDLA